MDLRCPKCNSTDLKKVSLAYEEGIFRTEAQTRMRAAVIGGSGADLVVGRASTHGSHESVLAKRLRPPVKWSYRKLVFWSALFSLCGSWLVFYVNNVTTNAKTVSSGPLTLFVLISAGIFALLLFVAWRHNHSTYQTRYGEWDRSFICQRCGAVSKQQVGA